MIVEPPGAPKINQGLSSLLMMVGVILDSIRFPGSMALASARTKRRSMLPKPSRDEPGPLTLRNPARLIRAARECLR